jgi:hypothetical protein
MASFYRHGLPMASVISGGHDNMPTSASNMLALPFRFCILDCVLVAA